MQIYGNTKLALMPLLPTLCVCEKVDCVTIISGLRSLRCDKLKTIYYSFTRNAKCIRKHEIQLEKALLKSAQRGGVGIKTRTCRILVLRVNWNPKLDQIEYKFALSNLTIKMDCDLTPSIGI